MQRAADAALAHRCEKTFAAAVTHFLCGNDSYSDQTAAAAAAPALARSLSLSARLLSNKSALNYPSAISPVTSGSHSHRRSPIYGLPIFFFLECVWGAHQFVMSSIVGLCFCDLRDTVFIRMS